MTTYIAPSTSPNFSLAGWKLQTNLRGGSLKDILDLSGYASEAFNLTIDGEIAFITKCGKVNSGYRRSELRHLTEWIFGDTRQRSMSVAVDVESTASPNKVTVAQIHGLGDNALPPIRVYFEDRKIMVAWKTNKSGSNTEHYEVAAAALGRRLIEISVIGYNVFVQVDGLRVFSKDSPYRPKSKKCYFKCGCYPQATSGFATSKISAINVFV